MQKLIQDIVAGCGITVKSFEVVHGGDINKCYCLHGPAVKYFLKLNDAARFPGMFEMEADGLDALRNNGSLIIPPVIKYGIAEAHQWLLLQWIEPVLSIHHPKHDATLRKLKSAALCVVIGAGGHFHFGEPYIIKANLGLIANLHR